jgi:sortase (surface protein transpeptidase)
VSDNQVRDGGYRGIIAAVVAVVLLVAGGVLIRSGLDRGRSGPQAPDAAQAQPAATASGTPTAPSPSGPRASATTGPEPAQSGTETAPAVPQPTVPKTTGKPTTKPSAKAASKFGPTLPRSAPTKLAIPAIGVDVRGIIDLKLQKNGELQVPKDFDDVGWFTGGPAPGQFGPAVLAGHVDSKSGPAVFWKLGEVKRGDRVQVGRADGRTATFVVDAVERYAKNAFPTTKVYGNTTNRSELRLITCGGTFDRKTGHYRDNVVVYAHQV